MDNNSNECWMYTWIDEFDISTTDQATRALKSPKVIGRLFDIAVQSSSDSYPSSYAGQQFLVAGQGFNLAGETTCASFRCARQEIDNIMSKAWHYFDKIVVAGPNPKSVASRIGETPQKSRDHLYWTLMNDVTTLLHLRAIGANDWLEFVPNSFPHCDECVRDSAIAAGLAMAYDEDLEDAILKQLEQEASIRIERQRGLWAAHISHDLLAEPMVYIFAKRPTRRSVASRVYKTHNSAAVRDFVKSQAMNLPLATFAQANWLTGSADPNRETVRDRMGRVALQLELPVIEGMASKDLLAFIKNEREHFSNFRGALRKAISENVARLDSKSDEEIANAVRAEYIEPELAKIASRLKTAGKSLERKSIAGLAVGALVTSVGLFTAMPLVIATGIAAAATPLPQLYKYFDDASQVEMSDMYFLWKMQRNWHGG